jgi:adenosine deaminase
VLVNCIIEFGRNDRGSHEISAFRVLNHRTCSEKCDEPVQFAFSQRQEERPVSLKARFVVFLVGGVLLGGAAAETPEERAGRALDSVRKNPSLLLAFLEEMPKGGDLHNHMAGAIYAESWIEYAAQDNLCVDRSASSLLPPPCDAGCAKYTNKPAVQCAYGDHVLYNQLVDAWSMRNWTPGDGSGHDHFFATFDKFLLASLNSVGHQLAEVAERAAVDRLQYVELMMTADGMQAAELGAKLGWDDDFGKMREKLLAGGLKDVIAATRTQVDREEARQRQILHCGTPEARPGCRVTIHYLYQVLRGLSREKVFAQIVLGFELAQRDPRFVGLNLVMPEDWYVPMHDFDLHMKMLDTLHGTYPKVHISLHAGELAMGLVPPEGLRFHIRESIERGHAERIGHGVSVMNEHDALGLLKEMAARKVLVEICLTSNAGILGVEGENHPLPTYLKYGVPVALASDDEGVSRSDMTHEYLRAVETYGFSYSDIKRMARQSLEYSFLPGQSLWQGDFRMIAACAGERAESKVSQGCQKFLDDNERARVQWTLEREFAEFERQY